MLLISDETRVVAKIILVVNIGLDVNCGVRVTFAFNDEEKIKATEFEVTVELSNTNTIVEASLVIGSEERLRDAVVTVEEGPADTPNVESVRCTKLLLDTDDAKRTV